MLRGIDNAFDKHDAKLGRGKGKARRINGLAWVSQSVLQAAEEAVNAATGVRQADQPAPSGFENEPVAAYLKTNAATIVAAGGDVTVAARLQELAASFDGPTPPTLEDLDRTLTVLEEKMFAALIAAAPEEELMALRGQAARELAPTKAKCRPSRSSRCSSNSYRSACWRHVVCRA